MTDDFGNGRLALILDLIASDDDEFSLERVMEQFPETVEKQRWLMNALQVRTMRELEKLCDLFMQSQEKTDQNFKRLWAVVSVVGVAAFMSLFYVLGMDTFVSVGSSMALGVVSLIIGRVFG